MDVFWNFLRWKKGNLRGIFCLEGEKNVRGKNFLKIIIFPSVLFKTLEYISTYALPRGTDGGTYIPLAWPK